MFADRMPFIIIALLVILLAVVLMLAVRRLILGIGDTLFDCALRRAERSHWRKGLAKYQEDQLCWYPLWGLTMWPKVRFQRGNVKVVQTEAMGQQQNIGAIYGGRIVRLAATGQHVGNWEMALGPGSTMGLLSWVESAPPGGDRND